MIPPGLAARRALTGFLFGSVGALIALSPVGKVSGAHINPAVTLTFWLERRMSGGLALGYVAAQLVGAVLGALPLRLWGAMGRSVAFGATVPGPAGPGIALAGEAGASFCLVAGLLLFVGHPRLRDFTPALFPPLYAVLVWLEAPLSGASTNPARTLGPGLVAGDLHGWWIYWLGPLAGALAAVALRRGLPWARSLEIGVAKVFHFHHDPYGILTKKSVPSQHPASGQ
jgi:aquaporin Z